MYIIIRFLSSIYMCVYMYTYLCMYIKNALLILYKYLEGTQHNTLIYSGS